VWQRLRTSSEEQAFEIGRTVRLLTCGLSALILGLVLSAEARAKGTGYVFVSNEKTNNIAVIDPKQDYKVIRWIPTSHRPRDMKFGHNRRLLYVACGDDDVIDVIDVATLNVADHIPTGPSPEMFEFGRDEKTLYVSNEEGSSVRESASQIRSSSVRFQLAPNLKVSR
jgi:YVTN family beta-propeller protein